jgi:hypothetical protein
VSKIETIEFGKPPTVAELIVALELLEKRAGGDAVVRVSGCIEFNIKLGPRIAAIRAVQEEQ